MFRQEDNSRNTIDSYEPRDGETTFGLSYSASGTLTTCEYQYACSKVWKLPIDSDADEDSSAFKWGKACHSVMESTEYEISNFNMALFEECLKAEGFYQDLPSGKVGMTDEAAVYAIYAACHSLFKLHKKQKLRTVKCEYEIKLPYTYGFIDAICVNAAGGWWIRDLKTSGNISDMELSARLNKDRQLNIYAHPDVLALIETELGLKAEEFLGARYTVVFKTKAKPKDNESMQVFAARVEPKVLDFEILRKDLDPEGTKKNHLEMMARALEIRSLKREPLRVFGGNTCFAYRKPCVYWSRCYGKTYTDCISNSVYYNLDNVKDLSCKSTSKVKKGRNLAIIEQEIGLDEVTEIFKEETKGKKQKPTPISDLMNLF